MKGRFTGFIFCALFLVVTGCANNPVFTVEVYKTATPFPTLPLVPINTPTLESVPALPTAASVTPVMPPDFSPVLYGKKYDANTFFVLLGAVQGNTWLAPDQAAAQFGGEWEYDVHTFTKGSFQLHGHAPEFSPPSRSYFIGTDSDANEFGMVGVLHGWPTRQGKVDELSFSIDVYQKAVMDWLVTQGISSPVLGTLHVFRVDLEADGVDEIFITATYLDESQHIVRAGDYSIVLMRKVVGNSAVTVPLVADIYPSRQESVFPSTYSIGNFIDLDRDGTLEIIVDIQGWEKFGAIVYQVDGETVTAVLK